MPSAHAASLSSVLNWTIPPTLRAQVDGCFQRTNWRAVCETASQVNGGQPCRALLDYTSGGSSLARLLEFQDGTRWIARIQLLRSTPETSRRLRIEIDTMVLLRTVSKASIPQVFAFELSDTNPFGAAYALFEFIPGNTAMDKARRYDRPDGQVIPRQYQQVFYRSMAAAHVSYRYSTEMARRDDKS